jgi:MFS family permease
MATYDSIKEILFKKTGFVEINGLEFLINLILAIILIIIGVFLGKFIKLLLRKLFDKIKLKKLINPEFIDMFLIIVKWSIYILFINAALIQLGVPVFTNWLTTILGTIPALTGALVIIAVGFAIATFLKNVIIESKVENGNILAQIFFFFINYVFIIFAIKTALISIKDVFITNILIIVLTAIAGIAFIIFYLKEKK